MAAMRIAVPHQLPFAEVISRVQLLFAQIQKDYGHMVSNFTVTWSGNAASFSFTAHGMDICGNAEVTASRLIITGDAPWYAKDQVEDLIREQAERVIRTPTTSLPQTPSVATPGMAADARQPVPVRPAVREIREADGDPFGLVLFFTALFELFGDIVAGGFDLLFGWVLVDDPEEKDAEELDPFKPIGDFLDMLFGDDEQ